MTKNVTDNPLLKSVVEIAGEMDKAEGKAIRLAHELAMSIKTGGNLMNKDELLAYANGNADKGWLTNFLTEQSHEFRKAADDAKDRENKNVSEAAKRKKRNILNVANNVLIMSAFIVGLPDSAAARVSNKGTLLIDGEDGEQIALSAKSCQKRARDMFGRTKTRAPQSEGHEKATSGKPLDILQHVTSYYTGRDATELSNEEWAELCLIGEIINDMKRGLQSKTRKAA